MGSDVRIVEVGHRGFRAWRGSDTHELGLDRQVYIPSYCPGHCYLGSAGIEAAARPGAATRHAEKVKSEQKRN